MKKSFLLVIALLLPILALSKATATDTVITMKTYMFSDPNPVPDPSRAYYPYFRFDGFSHQGSDRDWHMVVLENDYIKLAVCPEVGGKVWGATDKVTGKDFLYTNHVAKFRDIAMRGAWVSGGIEFNFGIIGHAPTSATPVDYMVKENADGSVSCIIASYELITRTYWNVEINVPADGAYFTTTTTWQNVADTQQPYYQWMNAAYKAADDAEMCYPGDAYIGHGGDAHSFPVDSEGRNLAWYRNTAFGADKSEHVLGYYNDYYGVYYHDEDAGSIHHSAFDDKFGQKIFTWSQARQGTIWEDLLTDADGQYIELQSGRMFNQPESNSLYTPYKHATFTPGVTDQWVEYWFPINGIDGVSKAGKIGAINVKRDGYNLHFAVSPIVAGVYPVRFYDGDTVVDEISMTFEPLKPCKQTIPALGNIAVGDLKIVIGDNDLVYTEKEDDYTVHAPKQLPADFPWDSARGLAVQGQQMLAQNYLKNAENYFRQALDKDEWATEAMLGLATVYVKQGRYEQALPFIEKALSLDAYNADAAYLYGLANQALGKRADAMHGFSIASRSQNYRSAAYLKLAEMYLAEKNTSEAVRYARKAIDANSMNAMAYIAEAEAYRQANEKDKASDALNKALTIFPMQPVGVYEQWLIQGGKPVVWQCELPAQNAIEAAAWLSSIGNHADAAKVLESADKSLLGQYLLAYELDMAGNEAGAMEALFLSKNMPLDQIFPYRSESLKALQWVSDAGPDWRTQYYLSLCKWANGMDAEAYNLLADLKNTPDKAEFYLCRANLAALQGEKDAQMADLLAAERIQPNWRTAMALIKRYAADGDWEKVIQVGQKVMKKDPTNYNIGLKLARAYMETGAYNKSLDLLSSIEVLPNEGAYEGRSVYRAACLHKAVSLYKKGNYEGAVQASELSKQWPENLGVGKPYDVDMTVEDYIEGLILSKQNGTDFDLDVPSARNAFDQAILAKLR